MHLRSESLLEPSLCGRFCSVYKVSFRRHTSTALILLSVIMGAEKTHTCMHARWGESCPAWSRCPVKHQQDTLFVFRAKRWCETCLCVTSEFNDLTFAFLAWSRKVRFWVDFQKNKLDSGEQGTHNEWRQHRAEHTVGFQHRPTLAAGLEAAYPLDSLRS